MKSKWVKILIEIAWTVIGLCCFAAFLFIAHISMPKPSKPYDKPILDRMYYASCTDGYKGVVDVMETAKATYEWLDQETKLPIMLGDCTLITVFQREKE